ncbi:hypothetical protein AOQ84DRAFT_381886 [Glonium stellatum]|uniref:Uncharacterized protein n=1 Tax=Glonium stellatum TaxID=574774 RepID=A0A8E2EQZ8_9PEZI|nr:hypothetical protein AOQ84DRAFT_381886 [Glonium stellatum]
MSDAQKCFAFLHENIPTWLKNAAEIEDKVANKQDEITRVPIPVVPVVKKTGSTESIRLKENAENEPIGVITEGSSAAVQQYQFQLAKRKRKTASVLSGNASGPAKYRSRTMIIVYYDSDVQKAFETLVRNIGTGRNLLRKGKMAARMEALAEAAAANEDDEDDEQDPVLSKIGYRPRNGLMFRTTRGSGIGMGNFPDTNAGTESFDAADKALEKAQTLCERGAHQFLRDGSCQTEIDGIKEHLDEVFKLSEREAAKAKKVEKKEIIVEPNGMEHVSKTVNIEVDDADDDDLEVALPPIRLTSRR